MLPEACPAATDLLLRLMSVSPEDAQLPLTVLVNLHRARLRAPLEAMRTFDPDIVEPNASFVTAEDLFERAFPGLDGARPFRQSDAFREVLGRVENTAGPLEQEAERFVAGLTEETFWIQLLIDYAGNNWVAYQPLTTLHRLTLGPDSLRVYLPLLEAELSASDATEAMILAMVERS